MPTRPRERLAELVIAAAVAGAASLAVATGALAPLERPVADLLVRVAAARPPSPPAGLPDVAVVALDPQSLRAFPTWPWPRRVYAEVLARLDAAGAKVVAFDIDFSSPRNAEDDALFAAAIARSGRVVLAAFRQVSRLPEGGELEVASVPLEPLADRARAVGSVLVPLDPDGVVRRAPARSSIAGRETPSLAAAALAVATGADADLDGSPLVELDWRRAGPAFPVVPLVDVVDGRFDPRDVAGRIVLVGATAAELQDVWATPLGPARPGVLVQAVALRTLAARRAGAPVLESQDRAERCVVAALLSAVAAAVGLGSHRRRLLVLGGLAAATTASSLALVVQSGLLVDPVLPLAVLGGHYVLGLEGLRSRFGRHLAERELSLSTLFRVGEATVGPGDGLGLALVVLGDVIGARGVALLRARPPSPRAPGDGGLLDGRRLEWRRDGGLAAAAAATDADVVGDLVTAHGVLADRRVRVFQGALPGGGGQRGLAVYVPLHAEQVAVGVLVVERDDPRDLDEVELRTIATVGAQLALAVENLRLLEGLRATFDASVAAIASAIEARDGYTEAHCRRLAAFSARMAERLGLPEQEVEAVRLGALLHDVGKIGIRDHVLLKPGRFTDDERREMQRHPDIGHRIIERIDGFHPTTLACVRHHHEWWNGTGYPDRLAGEAIPLGARIVAVVDVWDALSTVRPYKGALPQGDVLRHLEKGKGLQFDPGLVDLFLVVLREAEEGADLPLFGEFT
jgi:HD-GYP domain-containing protein (c-di-GMP phosphodiesterase class II)/CHASE2 domain-containing sensor protein